MNFLLHTTCVEPNQSQRHLLPLNNIFYQYMVLHSQIKYRQMQILLQELL